MALCEFLWAFAMGAFGYGAMELVWRGWTHWTMLIDGGVCFSLIYFTATRLHVSLWRGMLASAAAITLVELVSGVIVNISLGWNVWDYSAEPFNLLGQICPLYCLIWLAISPPCIALARYMRRRLLPRGA